MRPDQERVRNLLTDTVTLLCKNGLQYQTELRVQGVLGITLDNNDVFIVHINEKLGGDIGGAISIRNDEGDAAKTLLGGPRHDSRMSPIASEGDTFSAVNIRTEQVVVHRRQRRSRESSASPTLTPNSKRQHTHHGPIKRLVPSDTDSSPGNRSSFHNSAGKDLDCPRDRVRVKTEDDDIIVFLDNKPEISVTPQHIPHTSDQSAMRESYDPSLTFSDVPVSHGPFGEVPRAAGISATSDGAASPTKRLATTSNIHDSYSGSSEMGPTFDGPFVTGIMRNETVSGDVAPQTITATPWDPSQMPDFGSLSAQASQMIVDSTPGCSTWDTTQQSRSLPSQMLLGHSSESVVTGGSEKGRNGENGAKLTCGRAETLLSDTTYDHSQPARSVLHKGSPCKCPECDLTFTGKRKLWSHVRNVHGGRFACSQCDCTFVTRAGMRQHVRHIHDKSPRYRCETCGKGYSIRQNYYDHLATHSGVKRNVCSICLKQFTFKPSLKIHVLQCHYD